MGESEELKHATLQPEQTLRFRALELAILSERELRYIAIDKDNTFEDATCRLVDRADAFYGYILDSTAPEKPADNPSGDQS